MEPLKTEPKPQEKEVKSFGFIRSDSKWNQKVSRGVLLSGLIAALTNAVAPEVFKELWQLIIGAEQSPTLFQVYRYKPELYEQYKLAIAQGSQPVQRLSTSLNPVDPLMKSVLQTYLPKASDDAIVELGSFRLAYFKDQKACKALFSSDVPNASNTFPQEHMAEFSRIFDNVVETGSSQLRPISKSTHSRQLLSGIFQEMVSDYGEDVELLSPGSAQGELPAQACKVMADFYQRILQLPSNEVAPAMRYMVTNF